MSSEGIIQAILSKHPEMAEQQVLEELETEKTKSGGLIADATLLRVIAAKHGIQIQQEPATECKLLISHLVPSLNNVTVCGRVVAVYPARAFEGKQSGKYASLMITDKSGILRVMLWNSKTDIVESGVVKAGQIVRVSQGYTRDDRDSKTELHLSEKGDVEVDPEDAVKEDYPSVDYFATAAKDVLQPQPSIHVIGRVKAVFPAATFTRQDNSEGKVLHFTVADETGEVAVIAWNGKAETLEAKLQSDAKVKLVNAKAKAASNGGLEVHVDESTYVEVAAASDQS
jgi:replication factor A1